MLDKKNKQYIFSVISFLIILVSWWVASLTLMPHLGIIPSPVETFRIIGEEIRKDNFFPAVFSTLYTSFVSFLVAFLLGIFLAIVASFKTSIGIILSPIIAIFRAMPTMGVVLILLIIVGGQTPIFVALLIIFPMCYENMRAAIAETNPQLIKMAKVFKVPKWRQITSIYLPGMSPLIFSSIIAGFGLNIKVVISAEIMGFPSMSIGHLMLAARQGFNFDIMFAWLVIAVILSLICEGILRIIARLCMPFNKSPL